MPEACIAPPDLRELRELVRHRGQLVKLATAVKAGVWALLAKHNIRLPEIDLGGDTAIEMMDALQLPGAYATRLAAQRRLMLVIATRSPPPRSSSPGGSRTISATGDCSRASALLC